MSDRFKQQAKEGRTAKMTEVVVAVYTTASAAETAAADLES